MWNTEKQIIGGKESGFIKIKDFPYLRIFLSLLHHTINIAN